MKTINKQKILEIISGGVTCQCGYRDARIGLEVVTKETKANSAGQCSNTCCLGCENLPLGMSNWYSVDYGDRHYCPTEELSLKEISALLRKELGIS